jgi:hypothetical protein
MNEKSVGNHKYRFGLQVRLQPGTYSVGQETVGATRGSIIIDDNISNDRLEFYTTQANTHFFTGVVVKEV